MPDGVGENMSAAINGAASGEWWTSKGRHERRAGRSVRQGPTSAWAGDEKSSQRVRDGERVICDALGAPMGPKPNLFFNLHHPAIS